MLSSIETIVPRAIMERCAWVPSKTLPFGLLHISTDTELKTMMPRIPQRTLRMEDGSFPRICVSSSLMGCIYGYSTAIKQYYSGGHLAHWLGGYVIYRVPFDIALRPHRTLLSDVDISDEHWLFHDPRYSNGYQTERIGECFIAAVPKGKITDSDGKENSVTTECPVFYIHAEVDNVPLWLRQGEFLVVKKGYYRMQINHYDHRLGVMDFSNVSVSRITLEKYLAAKDDALVLLGHQCAGSYEW